MSDKITITMTDRQPVRIAKADWPILAEAQELYFDGEYESQANRKSDWRICVRRHADGRAIVYATFSYVTNWVGERCRDYAEGRMLAHDCDMQDIVTLIYMVASEMSDHDDGENSLWWSLAKQCIAELPAEDLTQFVTIRNINERYGDAIEFTAPTLEEAVRAFQSSVCTCGPDYANIEITPADYEVVEDANHDQ